MRKAVVALFFALLVCAGFPSAVRAAPLELVVQTGQFLIRRAVFSSDGKLLATGSADGSVKLWDTSTGEELRTLRAGPGYVETLAFSGDGKLLATGTRDEKFINLWEVASGIRRHRFPGYRVAALDRTGSRLATEHVDESASLDAPTRVSVRSVDTEKEEYVLDILGGALRAVRFDPTGTKLAVSSETTDVWDATTWRKIGNVAGTIAAFSPDGLRLTTREDIPRGNQPRDIHLSNWELPSLKALSPIPAFSGALYVATIAADGRIEAIGCDRDRSESATVLKIWDAAGVSQTGTLRRPNCYHEGNGVALSPDGRFLTRGVTYAEELVERETGRTRSLLGESSGVTSVAFADGGRTLLSSTFQGDIKAWSLGTATRISNFRTVQATDGSHLTTLAVSPNGKYVVTADARGDGLRIWDYPSHRAIRSVAVAHPALFSFAFSRDSRFVAVANPSQNVVIIYALPSGAELAQIANRAFADFSPDAQSVALSQTDGAAVLWDLKSRKAVRTLPGKGRTVFSPDGRFIASRGAGDEVIVWDAHTLAKRQTLAAPYSARVFAFSPDGGTLATAGVDAGQKNRVTLWDVGTGKAKPANSLHNGEILGLAFHPNGKVLASASMDRTIKLWDVATGRELTTLIASGTDDWVVVTPEGRYDASGHAELLMHWVSGTEPIAFDQLKKQYLEPLLLARTLRYEHEPLKSVASVDQVAFCPEVRLLTPITPAGSLAIGLKNRGGGIGSVQILVNNQEMVADARDATFDRHANEATVVVDLNRAINVKPGADNAVRIVAWNEKHTFSSAGPPIVWRSSGPTAEAAPPARLFIIASGISTYASEKLHLNYPSADAKQMAHALQLGAKNLFLGGMHVDLLTTTGQPGDVRPNKANIKKAFDYVRDNAKPDDVLIVFFAGHGLNINKTYAYPTAEANTLDLDDAARRQDMAITSDELLEWLKNKAQKKVLILDTCAAGAAETKLAALRGISSDQIKALEDLKDRSGNYVLMGASPDGRSYEASPYAQGLLTYALLLGMKGAAFTNDASSVVDVDVDKLLRFAWKNVPALAQRIGASQQPQILPPHDGVTFPIGRLRKEDRSAILLASIKPMIQLPHLQGEAGADSLDLEPTVRALLHQRTDVSARGRSGEPAAVLVDTEGIAGTIRASGTYYVNGKNILVKFTLTLGRNNRPFTAQGTVGKAGQTLLANDIVNQILENAAKLPAAEGFRPI